LWFILRTHLKKRSYLLKEIREKKKRQTVVLFRSGLKVVSKVRFAPHAEVYLSRGWSLALIPC